MVFHFVFIIIIILLITSKIQIEINNLKFTTKKFKIENSELISQKHESKQAESIKKITSYFNDNYNGKIKLLILSKIPIFWSNINKKKIQKIEKNEKIKNINLNLNKKIKNLLIGKIKQTKKQINVKIKKFNLKIEIGTDSTIFTSIIIPTISSIISIILARKKVNKENLNYEIKPVYNSRKFIKSCIFRYI